MNEKALRADGAVASVETSHLTQPQKGHRSGVFAKGRQDSVGWGLVLVGFDGLLRPVTLADGATLGTASKDALVDGLGVAPEHVRVSVRADGCYLEDLDTPQGTFVNGVRAKRIGLTHGDVVRLGSTIGIFVERELTTYSGPLERTGTLVHGPRQRKNWIEPIVDLLENGSCVCIEGTAGTGKRTMARHVAAMRQTAGEVFIVDGSSDNQIDLPTGAQPATWVVLDADKLPRSRQLEIAQAVGRTPGVALIATVSQPFERAVSDGKLAPWFASIFTGKRVTIASLEDRREDIPAIVHDIATRHGIATERITPDLLDALVRAGWPGGVPQLTATLIAAAETNPSGPIDVASVTATLVRANHTKQSLPSGSDPSLARARIEDALARANGSVASAARSLGMSRQSIYREAGRLGLDIARRKFTRS